MITLSNGTFIHIYSLFWSDSLEKLETQIFEVTEDVSSKAEEKERKVLKLVLISSEP